MRTETEKIELLRKALSACEQYMTDCGYFSSKPELAKMVRKVLRETK